MRRPHTQKHAANRRLTAALVIACFGLSIVHPEIAIAASSFRPTIFVSTEAFLAIDDDDTTADVVMRFGDTLAKTITFNRTTDRFEFNDDVYTTGAVKAAGTLSGALVTQNGAGTNYFRGNVGIGQTTADTALDVLGTISGSLVKQNGAGNNSFMGNVGIGTTSPAYKLDITGNGNYEYIRMNNSTNTAASFAGLYLTTPDSEGVVAVAPSGYTDVTAWKDRMNIIALANSSGVNLVSRSTTGDIRFITGGDATERARIDYAGNFGIGSTAPKSKLDVLGTISGALVTQNGAGNNYMMGNLGIGTTSPPIGLEIQKTAAVLRLSGISGTSSDSIFSLRGGATGIGQLFSIRNNSSTVVALNTQNNARLGLGVNSGTSEGSLTENLSITSTGNVGVNKTIPNAKFEVVGTISGSLVTQHGAGNNYFFGNIGVNVASPGAKIETSAGFGVGGPAFAMDNGNYLAARDTSGTLRTVLFGRYTDNATYLDGGVGGTYLRTNNGSTSNMFLDPAGNVGVNTATPKAKLDVVGTISGSLLKLSNLTTSGGILFNSGSLVRATAKGTSGSILVARATGTPEWKTPTSSLVWYIDGTLAVGNSQGAFVTMPYGFTATSVTMRVKGAPTGAALIVDLRKDGTSIFGTKPQINAAAYTGGGSATLSTTNLTAGSEISLDITQVGSTFAGSGVTVMLNGTRKY